MEEKVGSHNCMTSFLYVHEKHCDESSCDEEAPKVKSSSDTFSRG